MAARSPSSSPDRAFREGGKGKAKRVKPRAEFTLKTVNFVPAGAQVLLERKKREGRGKAIPRRASTRPTTKRKSDSCLRQTPLLPLLSNQPVTKKTGKKKRGGILEGCYHPVLSRRTGERKKEKNTQLTAPISLSPPPPHTPKEKKEERGRGVGTKWLHMP